MAEITFNKNYAGYVYSGAGTVWHRNDDGRFNGVAVTVDGSADKVRYVATGFTSKASDGSLMVNIQGEEFYDWIDVSSGEWTRGQMATIYSQSQAQDYVNKMIANNKQILMNNLFCARFADRLTQAEKEQLYGLQSRLMERNNSLQRDGFVNQQQSSEAYGYGELSPYLRIFMQNGVSLVISTTAIVISCLVIASVATAAYFAYKYYYEQSARDVKYSDKLTKALMSKLTEEEYQQLLQETQGIVTKASLKARLGNSFDIAKWAIIAVGVFTIYNLFATKTKSRKNGIPRSVQI